MPDDISAKNDRIGADFKQGPSPKPGGTVDVGDAAQPYEGRTTGEDDPSGRGESVSRMLADSAPGTAGQTASPAQESPAQAHELDDSSPDSPKGVGQSENRSAEDIVDKDGKEAGRHDLPNDSGTDRPVGTSDKRDVTGVG